MAGATTDKVTKSMIDIRRIAYGFELADSRIAELSDEQLESGALTGDLSGLTSAGVRSAFAEAAWRRQQMNAGIAWGRANFPDRKDIIGVRDLPDGRREFLCHNEGLCWPYYIAVSAPPNERSVLDAVTPRP